jgi:hypothetical protein
VLPEGVELEYTAQGTGEPVLLTNAGVFADWFVLLLDERGLSAGYQLSQYHRQHCQLCLSDAHDRRSRGEGLAAPAARAGRFSMGSLLTAADTRAAFELGFAQMP